MIMENRVSVNSIKLPCVSYEHCTLKDIFHPAAWDRRLKLHYGFSKVEVSG